MLENTEKFKSKTNETKNLPHNAGKSFKKIKTPDTPPVHFEPSFEVVDGFDDIMMAMPAYIVDGDLALLH